MLCADSEEAFAHVTKIRALQDELVEKHLEISQAHQRYEKIEFTVVVMFIKFRKLQ